MRQSVPDKPALFVFDVDYSHAMPQVGELVQATDGRWIVYPPKQCGCGHRLEPGKMTVGFQPCGGEDPGGHLSWCCGDCNTPIYAPPIGEVCLVLHGPAQVRSV